MGKGRRWCVVVWLYLVGNNVPGSSSLFVVALVGVVVGDRAGGARSETQLGTFVAKWLFDPRRHVLASRAANIRQQLVVMNTPARYTRGTRYLQTLPGLRICL